MKQRILGINNPRGVSLRMLLTLILVVFLLSISVQPAAAAVCSTDSYPYRTAASGTWAANATWQRSLDGGTTWIPAGCWPSYNNGRIDIRNGHTVTVDAAITVDQVFILTGGTVVVNSGVTWTILNGGGTDLSVSGTLVNAGTIAAGGTRVFNPGAVYRHAQDGGAILTGIWNENATIEVVGVVSTLPSGFNQAFGNVIWNNPGQTASLALGGNITANGNFTILSTGTGQLTVAEAVNRTITVVGNFAMADGTLDLSSGTATGRINVAGNFTHTGGTITESGTNATTAIIFNGTSMQTFTSGGTVTNSVNLTVNSGAFVNMGTSVATGGGRFTVQSGGTLGIGSPDGIATAGTYTGNIQTLLRTFTNGGNYFYNGTSDQITGNGLPANITGDLIVNNPGNTVTINFARNIATGGLINIVNGTLAAGTNLSMLSGSSIYRSGGGMTGTPLGAGPYDVFYNGNSMSSTSELTGAGLRNVTVTLNAAETLTLGTGVTINGDLEIIAGVLDTANNPLTLNGSFINSDTFTAGSSTITIGGTSDTPTFDSFTTTGPLNFTRTASTATLLGNVTAGELNINGAGGTLDLNAGLTHQVNGNVTITAGTLNANTSTLGLTGDWAYNGGTFSASTGTVVFNGAAEQTFTGSVTPFYTLTVAPGAEVVIPLTNSPTIDNTVVNNGGLRQSATIGAGGSFEFLSLESSVGDSRYRGIGFTSTDGDPGTVSVLVRGNQAQCDVYNFLIHRCFNIAVTGSATSTLTFYFEESELNASSCDSMQAFHWNGSAWDYTLTLDTTFYGDGRQCSGEGTADGTAGNPWAMQATGVNAFSPFGLTANGSPTAIQLLRLSSQAADVGLPVSIISIAVMLGGVVFLLRRKFAGR